MKDSSFRNCAWGLTWSIKKAQMHFTHSVSYAIICAWGVGTEWNEQGKLKPHHTWLTFWNHYSYQTFASGFQTYWSSGVSFLITMSYLPYQYIKDRQDDILGFSLFFYSDWCALNVIFSLVDLLQYSVCMCVPWAGEVCLPSCVCR